MRWKGPKVGKILGFGEQEPFVHSITSLPKHPPLAKCWCGKRVVDKTRSLLHGTSVKVGMADGGGRLFWGWSAFVYRVLRGDDIWAET